MSRPCKAEGCTARPKHKCEGYCAAHWPGRRACACGCGRLTSRTYAVGHGPRTLPPEKRADIRRAQIWKWQQKSRKANPEAYKRGMDRYTSSARGRITLSRSNFASSIRRNYGITVEEFAWLWERSNHACEICRTPLILDGGGKIGPHLDHCHATKVVRGILCRSCNQGIGRLGDSIIVMRRAIEYLKTRGAAAQLDLTQIGP